MNLEFKTNEKYGELVFICDKTRVEITIEQGAASVYLRHVCGETVCLDVDSDNRLAEEINAAIDAATAREGGEDGQ